MRIISTTLVVLIMVTMITAMVYATAENKSDESIALDVEQQLAALEAEITELEHRLDRLDQLIKKLREGIEQLQNAVNRFFEQFSQKTPDKA